MKREIWIGIICSICVVLMLTAWALGTPFVLPPHP